MADHVVVEKDSGSGMSALLAIVGIIVLAAIAWFAYQYFVSGNAATPTTNVNVTTPTVTPSN
jgi:hypothetical protein